jgi:hypothetical protein
MPNSNISVVMTPAQIAAIATAITVIRSNLTFLLNLTKEERKTLSKMGDDGFSYVTKALDYAVNNTNIIPGALSLPEAQKDLKLANDLRSILQQINQLAEGIDDTIMQAGVEAKDFSDRFYDMAKSMSSTNTPGLDVIVDDLGTFYDKAQAEIETLNPPA